MRTLYRTRTLLIAASALSLSLFAASALAQPVDPRGQGQGASQAQGRDQAGERAARGGVEWRRDQAEQDRAPHHHDRHRDDRGSWERDRDRRDRGHERRFSGEHRDHRGSWERDRHVSRSGPRIDEREIRRLFHEHRDWVEFDRRASLPPGIRMNLERGKPLPPGIAKRFDDRLHRELPRYDGYEWRRVGPDVVLVEMANDIIYAVLRDLFY
jgi:hypothetical protein